ncbi:intracellular sulfur oxidation DsrE/DsrF family protein [Desulfofundulus luciae]|uniref:Intracellular sulfur oxidation DsrE/DsrF family protein n=1 Tax=Desulfofundulus luciae TaxID=74702 RepID=A0ABU0B162_9FIRM|nr:intracellular sulfur oxidation DsrE/DsrF family protein [Desulfofundulus luciae]
MLTNINNFLRDIGTGKASILVLANGLGVLAYSLGKQDLIKEMENLHEQGVTFIACRNALNTYNISENKLPAFVTVVPAGITEIVQKQAQGYAYIKP